MLLEHYDCPEHYVNKIVDLTHEYKKISSEKCVRVDDRYRRPDILLESENGNQLWIEIWVAHETEIQKREDGRIIEIKINNEDDIEKIRQHNLIQGEGDGLYVRVFGIESGDGDDLFSVEEIDSDRSLPCERFFVYNGCSNKARIISHCPTHYLSDEESIIIRLNWKGNHNNPGGYCYGRITKHELNAICFRWCHPNFYKGQQYDDRSFKRLILSE